LAWVVPSLDSPRHPRHPLTPPSISQDDPALRPRILAAAAAAEDALASSPLTRHHHRGRASCAHLAGLPLASVLRYGRADRGGVSSSATLTSSPAPDERASVGAFSCYSAGAYLSGALHRATTGPLVPGAVYVYSVGDPERGWSPPLNFTAPAPPRAGSAAGPYTLAVVGDLGQTADSADTLAAIAARGLGKDYDGNGRSTTADPPTIPGPVQSVLNVGDLSYADGFQPRWDAFGRLVSSLTSRVPMQVIEGNHEEELAGGKPGFLAYKKRYAVPSTSSASPSPLFYSYDLPSAHVVMLGTYADWGPASPQRAWLAADLATVDRGRTPWLLVGMHAPWYSTNTAHLDEVEAMRLSLEPLLLEHGADLVFTGHVHAYERTARVARRKRHGCGPAHIVVGDGGNREGLALHWLGAQPPWSLFREASFGHGALTLVNATHARWEWVRNQDGPGAPPGDAAWFVHEQGLCHPADRAALVSAARADFEAAAGVPGGLLSGARTVGLGYATEQQVVGGGVGAAAA
jgi:acid phosphatase type 7